MVKTTLFGRLVADAVTKEVNGAQCTTFRMAADTIKKGDDGKYVAMFYNVTTWRKTAELCAGLSKGKRVMVIGDQYERPYKDKNGNDRISHELQADTFQFIDSRAAENDPFNS